MLLEPSRIHCGRACRDFGGVGCSANAFLSAFFAIGATRVSCANNACARTIYDSRVNCSGQCSALPPPILARHGFVSAPPCSGLGSEWCVLFSQMRDAGHVISVAPVYLVMVRARVQCVPPLLDDACKYLIPDRRPAACSARSSFEASFMLIGNGDQFMSCPLYELRTRERVSSQDGHAWQRTCDTGGCAWARVTGHFQLGPLKVHASIPTHDLHPGAVASASRCAWRFHSWRDARSACVKQHWCAVVQRDNGIPCWTSNGGDGHHIPVRTGRTFSHMLASEYRLAKAAACGVHGR